MKRLRHLFAGRRTLFALWLLVSAAALAATVRLSVFMVDPARSSYSVRPGSKFMRRHSCLSAYVTAADRLGEARARLYDPEGYRRRDDDARRRIPLGPFEMDRYEYPPTFLLLPRLFLLVSHQFAVLRALWFVFMLASVLGAMAAVARWIGGREGLVTALLIPTLWGALPNLLTVQVGNVQLLVFAMAILGMLAFDARRPALGGALLAFAIGAKLSPGVLLLALLVQRRWRDALWTTAFGALYCGAVVAVAGLEPFREFFGFQLPRLLSGEAFVFFKDNFEEKVTSSAIFAMPYKLELLGLVRDPDRWAPLCSRAYGLALAALVVVAARRAPGRGPAEIGVARARRAMFWMALLNLAVMQAPFLPPYGLLGTVWLMTVWAPLGRRLRDTALLFAAGWSCLMVVLPGPAWAMLVMGLVTPLVNVGINVAALLYVIRQPRPRGTAPAPAPPSAPGGTARARWASPAGPGR
jgi:hypothetical protein